jgi:hypothetical protein
LSNNLTTAAATASVAVVADSGVTDDLLMPLDALNCERLRSISVPPYESNLKSTYPLYVRLQQFMKTTTILELILAAGRLGDIVTELLTSMLCVVHDDVSVTTIHVRSISQLL